MTRELLQQALETDPPLTEIAKEALREALAAPQPEPYGHVTTHTVTGQQFFYRYPSPPYLDTAKECIAVYAAPPAAPAPAVPANKMGQGRLILEAASGMHGDVDKQLTAIYTDWLNSLAAPAVREPLTDEQIDALWRAPMSADWEHREFARAIEAHHGIGGGGNG